MNYRIYSVKHFYKINSVDTVDALLYKNKAMSDLQNKKPVSTVEWLIEQIDVFLTNNAPMSEESFGWHAIKDTSLVGRLRSGGDVTTRKLDRIIAYLHNPNQ